MQRFVGTLKSLPILVLKMYAVFSNGNTVGAYYLFTISKSYLEFCKGTGSSIAMLVSHKYLRTALFVALQFLGVIIFSIPFFKFFQWDRSTELLDYGFDLSTDTSKFKTYLAIISVVSAGVFGAWVVITKKRRDAGEEKGEDQQQLISE